MPARRERCNVAAPEELGLELEQATHLLGQLARSAETHHLTCQKLQSQWGEIQAALNIPLPEDQRKLALDQGGVRLDRHSQETRQTHGELQGLDASGLHDAIARGGDQMEQLGGLARRAAELANLETTRTVLTQGAGAVDGHRQELRGAHEQSRAQALDCWQSGESGRSQWETSYVQVQEGTRATQQRLQEHGANFVDTALKGTLGWFDEQHAPGLKTVAGRVDQAAGALAQYLSNASQSAQSHADSSRDALHQVQARAGEHRREVQQAVTKTLSTLENSQGQARQSSQTVQNASAEARRLSGLLGQVQDLAQLLDPKAWELP